jgi:hypothetical protein
VVRLCRMTGTSRSTLALVDLRFHEAHGWAQQAAINPDDLPICPNAGVRSRCQASPAKWRLAYDTWTAGPVLLVRRRISLRLALPNRNGGVLR